LSSSHAGQRWLTEYLLLAAIWGASFLFMRLGATEFGPLATAALLKQAQQQLNDYFAGRRRSFDLPLRLDTGTPFQNAVWQALTAIAYGTTCSYAALAQRLQRPSAVRAVAAAVGRNPLSILVPCHRVIGSRGQLTGYAGGLTRKRALLHLEGVPL